MMWNSRQQQLKHLLVETIQVLCKNSLPNESSFCIEATIGITLSTDHVMVISFKERIKSDGSRLSLMITDEHDSEQSQNNKSNNHSHFSFPHSSCSRTDNNVQLFVSENPTVYDESNIAATFSNCNETNGEVNMFDMGVTDSEAAASSCLPPFGSTEVSVGNHFHLPSVDQCTVAQSPSDHDDDDTKDDIVILKVEDGNDGAHVMPQLNNEVPFPHMQPHLNARKQKSPRARFVGNVVQHRVCLRQPTSASFEPNNIHLQRVDGPRQHNATYAS